MVKEKLLSFQYFVAYLPPQLIFLMHWDELLHLVKSSKDTLFEGESNGNTTAEVCLIGLVAHFEAYLKNQFASLVNIYPPLVERFCEKRNGISVPLYDVYKLSDKLKYQLGTLLAEDYDFGNANKINSLFYDLIGITPFSKDDVRRYSELIIDRNLLVHNAGIYTHKYHKQKFQSDLNDEERGDSILIDKEYFFQWANYIADIVIKINSSCMDKLKTTIKKDGALLSDEQVKAIESYLRSPGFKKKGAT